MTAAPVPLGDKWKVALNIEHRVPPAIFEREDEVRDTLHAAAVRTGLNDLGLSGVFCVHGVPAVAIRNTARYATDDVLTIHGALWNQGLASVFIDIAQDTARVFSLARACRGNSIAELEDACLFQRAGMAEPAASELPAVISGVETGRLWHEQSEYFRANERIDTVLLQNLQVAHYLLVQEGLPSEQAQAALIQTMFIAYLEDREIINGDYFTRKTNGRHGNWADILASGDSRAMESLFNELHRDFNGDLFVAPSSFFETVSSKSLTSLHLKLLARFRIGKESMSRNGSGQLRFWGYNFRYIPIELISEVYDNFLSEDPEIQQRTRAFYTPMFLADTVLSSTWSLLSDTKKQQGTFLDPACGSGVFLVKIFQRLCEHWRESNLGYKTATWDDLIRILYRIHGQDISSTALQIAIFSLYLALLDQVESPDLQGLLASKRRLPSLLDNTLRRHDYFDSNELTLRYDTIIGNPPWASGQHKSSKAVQWCEKHKYPIPRKELAWAFTWKAISQLNEEGMVAFLLPAMAFLHNQAQTSVRARNQLFDSTRVRLVADLSDLRRQLFARHVHPTTFIVASKLRGSPSDHPYQFNYLAPKATANLALRRFVPLSSIDKARLTSSDIANNSRYFKERLRMWPSEANLFWYLSQLPRISKIVQKYRRNRGKQADWTLGLGFQSWSDGSSAKPVKSSLVGTIPFLPAKQLTPIRVDDSALNPWLDSRVRRLGFESGFRGNRILVSRGIATSKGRLKAAYVDRPLTFKHIIMAVNVPKGQEDMAKFITAYLNSHLALWFAFHGTASFGAERAEINQTELLRLPLPHPDDLSHPQRAKKIRSELIREVNKYWTSRPVKQSAIRSQEAVLESVDRLIYEYFGLSEDEIALVEEFVDYTLPAVHPSLSSFPKLWEHVCRAGRKAYADAVSGRLAGWLVNGRPPSVRLLARNRDFAIVELSIESGHEFVTYSEDNRSDFAVALANISRDLGQPVNVNFLENPNVRVFVGKRLYLIKPLQRRFWLRSSAMADADDIAMHLESLWRTSKSRR